MTADVERCRKGSVSAPRETIDVIVIQAILGHAAPLTTRGYQQADLTMSRTALDRLTDHLT